MKVRQLTLLALLFSLALVLSFMETSISAMMMLPPGVKLGLANIVTMFTLFVLDTKSTFSLLILKSLFTFLTRGLVASLLSFSGGFLSVIVMLILLRLKKSDLSVTFISIVGAIFHNIGQILMSIFIIGTVKVAFYLPILLISGVVTGFLTGVIYNQVIKKLHLKFQRRK